MNRIVLVFTFALAAAGCSAGTSADDPTSSDDAELRGTTFYEKHPFAGARMRGFENALGAIDEQGTFVRNYHRGTGVHWDGNTKASPTLVLAAYKWWSQGESARNLVPATPADALDNIGLVPDMQDAKTAAARAALEKTLTALVSTKRITLYKATLPKEDMYWHNLLVVIDEDSHEILFETGGYGN